MRKLTTLLILTLFQTLFGAQAFADLKVEGRPRWGFDGTIRVEEFNLLTVRVFNDSENPWQGDVWVKSIVGIGSVDVPVIQPNLFIEPYGFRQLQFYVFLPDQTEVLIEWGRFVRGRLRAEGDATVDSPKPAYRDINIRLTNADSGQRGKGLATFDEQLFPSSAVVLHPIKTIVLDHVPRWQEPQTRAFKDWLFGGGTLNLIADSQGAYPDFPTSLAELNEPSDQFPVGYGTVIRSKQPIAEKAKKAGNSPQQRNYKNLSSSGTLVALLRAMTTPEHNWTLIYSLAVLYLLILFPGCWLLGRKKGDYRLTYTVILATVGLFSFGFHSIGKRGYGEKTSMNSVAVVRPAQPGRWVVKQWSNLFITTGGNYRIEYDITASAISTGQHSEAVLGIATNQPDSVMQSDIPSFSNRSILHSGILKKADFRPTAMVIVEGEQLKQFVLSLPESETWPKFSSHIAVYKDRFFQLRFVDGQFRTSGSGEPLASSLDYESLRYNPFRYGYGNNDPETPGKLFDKTIWPIIAEDLDIYNEDDVAKTTTQDNQIRVYLTTEMDAAFFAKGEISDQQTGRVVYAFEFPTETTE